jgi:Icc-related predicted phosphoesterase
MLTRILYTTDLHGSETVFLKFLNAAKMYKADVAIMGGDMTGKMIVPIVKLEENKYRARLLGTPVVASSKEELEKLEFNIRYNGFYPYHTSPEEMEELNKDPGKVDALFKTVMVNALERWMSLAEKRLKDLKLKVYMTPGNDDSFAIDDVLNSSKAVINPEEKVVSIDDHHEMISSGFSNLTPFESPREVSEEELEKKIETQVSQVREMENCIFNFHCPPYNSGLDIAPKLGKDLKPVIVPGTGMEMIPVGSTAVRNAIEQYQPLMGLHGHIHEARGEARIGRTVCYNPGSEYGEGILRGVIVNIDEKKVKSRLFVSG